MSHNVVITNVKFADSQALQMAVTNLANHGVAVSLEFPKRSDETVTFRTWPGQPNTANAVIRLPNERFDVGLIKQNDGTYLPVFDHMLSDSGKYTLFPEGMTHTNVPKGVSMGEAALGLLTQEYAVCVAEIEAAMAGHGTQRVKQDDGSVAVIVTVN